jgi:hypothetical protein
MYLVYARAWPGGPSGRTWPGMWFGVAASACMLFAGLLAVRKKTVRLQLGNLSWWLRGHLWLGALSVPLVFYHAAFRWGGTLETLLWLTFGAVIVSGVVGLALQNAVPRMMKHELPDEIIPDQFAQACSVLTAQADELVLKQCGPKAMEAALRKTPADQVEPLLKPAMSLAEFYLSEVRTYLASDARGSSSLGNAQHAQLLFERVSSLLPFDFHAAVEQLEAACDQRRQWGRQMRLYGLLHGWLKIHIPFSIALLVFAVAHIVSALYY